MCKIAKVVPIFKSETGLLSNNYRPISLLSNIGKIIEKLIHLRLNLSLETCNSYYLFQFGFRLNLVELLAKKNGPRSQKSFAMVMSKQAFSEC